MERVCAWCKKKMGTKGDKDDKRITHGICKKCAEEFFKEYKLEKK